MTKLTANTKALIIGLTVSAIAFTIIAMLVAAVVAFFNLASHASNNPDFTYSLKSVDCSQEAKDLRDKTPRGEYNSTTPIDACVITLTITNNSNTADGDDYMAIGGGPAGVLSKPPIKIYSGNDFCYGIPTQQSFPANSSTDVWISCLGSNSTNGQDLNSDQQPTKIIIEGRDTTVLTVQE